MRWVERSGKEHEIRDMGTNHIINCVKHLKSIPPGLREDGDKYLFAFVKELEDRGMKYPVCVCEFRDEELSLLEKSLRDSIHRLKEKHHHAQSDMVDYWNERIQILYSLYRKLFGEVK